MAGRRAAHQSTGPHIDDPASIVAIFPHDPQDFDLTLSQIQERVHLVKAWDIKAGERVLEIGCGQGECTATLAAAVGAQGLVTALDSASLDYGSPYTLGEAQGHLRASPLGNRMKFIKADPLDYLARTTRTFTTAVFSHCIYYFSSPAVFAAILERLVPRVARICVAEWALCASHPRAMPHVLAALTSAALQCHKPVSESNIRTVLSPAAMRAAAASVGLAVAKEETIIPAEGMADGRWETRIVLSHAFAHEIDEYVKEDRERAAVHALRDSVKAAVATVRARGKRVRAMDVWIATFTRA
ncbi:S-adenosyl-L-methionine-dependent methyltransferase [Amylocystis lapponica]|nr:S-adenosyl-L-methionine-dependent methyltransferase [Amylocystis lapponica]